MRTERKFFVEGQAREIQPDVAGSKRELRTGIEGETELALSAAGTFEQASQEIGTIIKADRAIRADPNPTGQEKTESKTLSEKAAGLLKNFYHNAKRVARLLPLALALYEPGRLATPLYHEELAKETQRIEAKARKAKGYLERKDLPLKAAFVDWYLGGEFLTIYNKFAEFQDKRKDGGMTLEEIEFREKISQNFFPYGYPGGSLYSGELDEIHRKIKGRERNITSDLARFRAVKEGKGRYVKEKVSRRDKMDQVRFDLFRKYLGLPQYFDTLKESDYKPTKSKDPNAKYYCFDVKEIVRSIKEHERNKQAQNKPNFETKIDRKLTGSEDFWKPVNNFADLKYC